MAQHLDPESVEQDPGPILGSGFCSSVRNSGHRVAENLKQRGPDKVRQTFLSVWSDADAENKTETDGKLELKFHSDFYCSGWWRLSGSSSR